MAVAGWPWSTGSQTGATFRVRTPIDKVARQTTGLSRQASQRRDGALMAARGLWRSGPGRRGPGRSCKGVDRRTRDALFSVSLLPSTVGRAMARSTGLTSRSLRPLISLEEGSSGITLSLVCTFSWEQQRL